MSALIVGVGIGMILALAVLVARLRAHTAKHCYDLAVLQNGLGELLLHLDDRGIVLPSEGLLATLAETQRELHRHHDDAQHDHF